MSTNDESSTERRLENLAENLDTHFGDKVAAYLRCHMVRCLGEVCIYVSTMQIFYFNGGVDIYGSLSVIGGFHYGELLTLCTLFFNFYYALASNNLLILYLIVSFTDFCSVFFMATKICFIYMFLLSSLFCVEK